VRRDALALACSDSNRRAVRRGSRERFELLAAEGVATPGLLAGARPGRLRTAWPAHLLLPLEEGSAVPAQAAPGPVALSVDFAGVEGRSAPPSGQFGLLTIRRSAPRTCAPARAAGRQAAA